MKKIEKQTGKGVEKEKGAISLKHFVGKISPVLEYFELEKKVPKQYLGIFQSNVSNEENEISIAFIKQQ